MPPSLNLIHALDALALAIAAHADPVAIKSTAQSSLGHLLVTWHHKGTDWVRSNKGKLCLSTALAGLFWGPFYDVADQFLPSWSVKALCAVSVLGAIFWAALIPPVIKTATLWIKHWRPEQ